MNEDRRRGALLDARAALLARRDVAGAPEAETQPFLVCACGGERIGLSLSQVGAVLPMRPCTRLPQGGTGLRGIVALSGTIVTVIELAPTLGLDRDAVGEPEHLVRLRVQEPALALAVVRALGIARIPAAAIDDGEGGIASGAGFASGAGLGRDALSGYAPPGSDAGAQFEDGFTILDVPRLLRRILS